MVTSTDVPRRSGSLVRIRRWLRRSGYERRWVVLGTLIGVVGGIGAIVFTLALQLATHLFLGGIAGFVPASPVGEGGAPITDALRPWALPLCVAFGGLISGLIVTRWAPEAEGHGTDAAIAAFHHRPRGIRARVPVVKLVVSAVTIGSGGSAGREGPTAQISAGFGSFLARTLDLGPQDARIAVASGMAAGIGAIFRAPLGAAILGGELMYRDDVESSALLPSFIATIVAFAVYTVALGGQPIFGMRTPTGFDPVQLGYYAVIGLAAGLVGRLYIRSFRDVSAGARRWPVPVWLRPAIGGFIVGCIGLIVPAVLGTGYGWVQAGLDRESLLGLPLLMVLVLPFAKIAATSLSIGTGGSGGVFGPGMVIGGLVGASVWRLLDPVAPHMPVDPAPFVIVGMMALFGSIAHAPLAVMLMVAEMTGDLTMLAPAMVAVGVAMLVVRERSIYDSQLATKADSPAHRARFAMPVLATIPVSEAMRAPRSIVHEGTGGAAARHMILATGVAGAPVVDASGVYRGVVDVAALSDDLLVADHMDPRVPTLLPNDALDDALGTIIDADRSWAPVLDDGRVAGVLSVRDVIAGYRTAIAGSAHRVRGLHDAGVLMEAVLPDDGLAGRTIASIPWPARSVVVSVERAGELVVPEGSTVLQARDRLTILTDAATEDAVRSLLDAGAGMTGDIHIQGSPSRVI